MTDTNSKDVESLDYMHALRLFSGSASGLNCLASKHFKQLARSKGDRLKPYEIATWHMKRPLTFGPPVSGRPLTAC